MKIACIGAGGNYFARPLTDFAKTPELKGCDIALYDIDLERAKVKRAKVMGRFGERMSKRHNSGQTHTVATTLKAAIEGADFVLASIGGTGASGKAGYTESPIHLGDNMICAEFGVPQVIGDICGP